MAALAPGGYGFGSHFVAEFDHRNETVATGSIPFLRSRICAGSKRGERAVLRGGELNWDAGTRVVKGLDDIAGQALESIDVAPRRLPTAEVGCQFVGCIEERFQEL